MGSGWLPLGMFLGRPPRWDSSRRIGGYPTLTVTMTVTAVKEAGVKRQRLRARRWAMILHPNLARAPVAREHEVAQDIPPDQAVNSVGLQLCAPDLSVDENLVDARIRDPGAQSKDNPPDIYPSGRIDTYPMERIAGVDQLETCLLCGLVLDDSPI